MQAHTPELSDEITFFIIEGTHRLAAISVNDYGFLQSARMAQTYLVRAVRVLDSIRGFDRAFFNEVSRLNASAADISREYAQLEAFCTECDRFDQLQTRSWIERVSKLAVRALSGARRATIGQHLAYKIRGFHSRLCSVLTGK